MKLLKPAMYVTVKWHGHFDTAYWPVRKIECGSNKFTIYYWAKKQVTFYAHKGYTYEVCPGTWEGTWPSDKITLDERSQA